jgi:hypothetical protein
LPWPPSLSARCGFAAPPTSVTSYFAPRMVLASSMSF